MIIDPLLVDLYPRDFGGKPNVQALVAAGAPWHGISIKATEGTYYPRNTQRQFFLEHWLPARIYAMDRYGADPASGLAPWWREAYHYHRVDQDPIKQAENFLYLIEEAGGWGPGDLPPMIDVESAENPADASAAQIEDSVSGFTGKIYSETGYTSHLYGNVYLAEHGVKHHMGCGLLTVARYLADLPPAIYQRIGWQLAVPPAPVAMPTVLGWQYSGDPEGGHLHNYPTKCPLSTTENADIIALIVAGGGRAALDFVHQHVQVGSLR